MADPDPNPNVNLSGSGVVLHVQRPDGELVPVQGNDAGAITVASEVAGPGGEELATEATADRAADAVEALAGALDGNAVRTVTAEPQFITAPPGNTAAPAMRVVGDRTDRFGNPVLGVEIVPDEPIVVIQGDGSGDPQDTPPWLMQTVKDDGGGTMTAETIATEETAEAIQAATEAIAQQTNELEADADATRVAAQSIDTKLGAAPAQDRTTAGAPSAVRLSDGTNFVGDDANPLVMRWPIGAFTSDGAQRTSHPTPLYEYGGAFVHNPDEFGQTGTGTYTFDTTDLSDRIAVDGASGKVHAWQTHTKVRFPTSSPLVVRFVIKFSDNGQANQVKGFYTGDADAAVGLGGTSEFFMLRLNGTDLEVATQSALGGGVIQIPRAVWLDPLDGSGPSGVDIDLTQYHTFDALVGLPGPELGMLRVDGILVLYFPAHFVGPVPLKYMHHASGMLIQNTGATSPGSISCRGFSVHTLGESITPTLPIQVGHNAAQSKSITTSLVPVMSLRPKATLNGLGFRGSILPRSIRISNTGGRVDYFILRNTTSLTGASWVSAKAVSGAEFDISATAFTGGEIVDQGSISDTIGETRLDLGETFKHEVMHLRNYALGVSGPSGQGRDNLVVAMRTPSGSATVRVNAIFDEK